ncbi:MAG: gephyrin-like molybdotransferase Glp [Halodesulfurarchaeum sp.]
MTGSGDRRAAGFKHRTRLGEARATLREVVPVVSDVETVSISNGDGAVLAETLRAERDVPHYPRAAMDGYAVRASDTFGASDRSPNVLTVGEGEGGAGKAVRVHTGSELPSHANAVVMIEQVESLEEEIEVFDAVAEGENVGPVGEDVSRGTELYEPGHRLRPSDLGLLKSVGIRSMDVRRPPTVAVIPTGEEVVQEDPGPGEVVETNGLTVSRLVERWGGEARYRDVVPDDEEKLRAAIERNLEADILVTTGGSSVGKRDLTPEIVGALGEVLVHGVAIKPGHPVAIGRIDETPVLLLPGYPVSCIVNAMQFLRPALRWASGTELIDPPGVTATLDAKLRSEPGVRTFARVQLEGERTTDPDGTAEEPIAVPVSASGAGVLSSVALADGWVQIPESVEGIPEGETVAVERWEALP